MRTGYNYCRQYLNNFCISVNTFIPSPIFYTLLNTLFTLVLWTNYFECSCSHRQEYFLVPLPFLPVDNFAIVSNALLLSKLADKNDYFSSILNSLLIYVRTTLIVVICTIFSYFLEILMQTLHTLYSYLQILKTAQCLYLQLF